MSFASRLAQALPKRDVNGDFFEIISRDRVWEELHGLYNPIKDRFVSVEHDPTYPQDLWLTHAEEIQAGRARLVADLNTEEGRAAFLECWWPVASDGVCVAQRAEHGKEEGLPYPTQTLLRRAQFRHLLAPDLSFDVMRLGTQAIYTTGLRALWDCGVRRILLHQTSSTHTWLNQKLGGLSTRLIPLPPNDTLRTYAYAPGHPEEKEFAFFLDVTNRPQTDIMDEWLKGTP